MMIANMPCKKLTEQDIVLERLNESNDHKFYLTGSRFFGNHRPDSDYDFFVKDSAGLAESLMTMNFVRLNSHRYNDSDTVAVYVNALAKVHIQLVLDPILKNCIQEACKELNHLPPNGSSSSRRVYWDLLFAVARAARSVG